MFRCPRCGATTAWIEIMGLKPFHIRPGAVEVRTATIGADIINIVTPRSEIFEGTPVDKSEAEQLRQSGQRVRSGFILHNSVGNKGE